MAQGKSLLSLRGEINWVTGDYSNIVADTKRLVAQSNGAALGEMRTGARGREQQFKQSPSIIQQLKVAKETKGKNISSNLRVF